MLGRLDRSRGGLPGAIGLLRYWPRHVDRQRRGWQAGESAERWWVSLALDASYGSMGANRGARSATVADADAKKRRTVMPVTRPLPATRYQRHARCRSMPSARYYRDQAKLLLSWARAANDPACAARLRTRAANALEEARDAREAVSDLNPILSEFNQQQLFCKPR